ncbi:hypothetical protein V8E53_013494 [Lactarius tabidus]
MPSSMHCSGYFDSFGQANVDSNATGCVEGSKEEASGAGASALAGWEEGSAIEDGTITIEVYGLESGVEEVIATPQSAVAVVQMKQVDEGGYQDQDLFVNVWTWGASLLADELRARTALSRFINLKLLGNVHQSVEQWIRHVMACVPMTRSLYLSTMPPKPLKESTGLENYMLYKAAQLLAAVRWVAENPPTPEKEDYLNKMVLEEIAFIALRYALYMDPESRKFKIPCIHLIIQIMTDKWKAGSHEQQKPHWDIFTEETIAYVCDQVATQNPTWYPHFYAMNLTSYYQSILTFCKAALQEPDNPSAPAAEVDTLPISAPSPVRLLMQAAKKVSDSNNNETPMKKVTEVPIFEVMQGAGRDGDTAHFRYVFKNFCTLQLHVGSAAQEGSQGKGKGKGKRQLHKRSHQWPDKLEQLVWIIIGQGVKQTIYLF